VDSKPAVAEKFASVAPAATVTDPGTVNAATPLERITTVPPPPAALDSDTVQVETAPDPRIVGGHVTAFNAAGGSRTVTVGADPLRDRASSVAETPCASVTPIVARVNISEASVAVTTATTPLCIRLLLNPKSTQVAAAAPEEH
jgi:hypothetical protein